MKMMMKKKKKERKINWWLYEEMCAGVCEEYEAKGCVEMYAWQVECLNLPGVTSGRTNLIYSAPTSGITLITLIALIALYTSSS